MKDITECENECENEYPCEKMYNCCDCGGVDGGCGCPYCWSCNACDTCKGERES